MPEIAIWITAPSETGERRRFALRENDSGVTIGRSPDVDVCVTDGSVSRRHCAIRFRNGAIEVRDLASANGTFVNGHRIVAGALQPGDSLRAGTVEVKVEVESSPFAREKGDLNCESCGRLITLSTVKDGQIVGWGDRILCPACKDGQVTLFGMEKVIETLAHEGINVLSRLSPAASATPVFKARRAALGDIVGVKVLPLGQPVTGKKLERFQTEARAMAQIQHPNVVRVYDVRVLPDLVYLVMEYVDGETLQRRLEREGKLSLPQALGIGIALTRALEAIAKQGIVHRDVKPANILMARDGTPKLGDFGLSKDLLIIGSSPTADQETLGTIRYMPPEQAFDAKQADYRSDIYSLAATIFHLVTGKLPHHERSEVELLRAVVNRGLPPFDPRGTPGLPEPLAAVLAKAMSSDPPDRQRSAIAFREDLVQAQTSLPGTPPRRPTERLAAQTQKIQIVGLMSGNFGNEQLVELVQMLGVNSKTGFLSVTWDQGEGLVAVKDGKIIAARTSKGLKAQDAVFAILALPAGEFEFRPGIPGNFKVEHTLSVEGLLLESLRRRDDAGR